ncbi:MAG: hypothetical protein CVT84_13775 [Alphaproteobacteria bacterium HGW-Alphaproteobacteria-6]|nr:MAG: hypothetical protein CVT84_13775 [Alphaproteobacteria bacterium HGW-Alphaproteobacteria-6]
MTYVKSRRDFPSLPAVAGRINRAVTRNRSAQPEPAFLARRVLLAGRTARPVAKGPALFRGRALDHRRS